MSLLQTQRIRLLRVLSRWSILLCVVAGYPLRYIYAADISGSIAISDFQTDKARYNPEENVHLTAEIIHHGKHAFRGSAILLAKHLDRLVYRDKKNIVLRTDESMHITYTWTPPSKDFQGYLVTISVLNTDGRVIAHATTGVDISSDWKMFPRYGYVAHYDKDINTASWVSDLNRFHINGIQFYDVVWKQHLPLSGTAENPSTEWPDIGNHPIYRSTMMGFIDSAHKRNMMAMVYDPAYAVYADALHDGSGVKLKWAVWPDKSGPRSEQTVKNIPMPPGFATPRLLYMNVACSGWRSYIFAQMKLFFQAFPFDGWHIDTYGDPGAYSYNRSYVNYYQDLPSFVDAARGYLHERVVLNTVGGGGEDDLARSRAEFVYSELWPPDHPTYESILQAADQIDAANPRKAIVFAAYLHASLADKLASARAKRRVCFDTTSVLLADATIFASGASHIELGDDARMLSGPYFPDDHVIALSAPLRRKLYNYYNFLVGYENFLRGNAHPDDCRLSIRGFPQSTKAQAGTVWTICRRERSYDVISLINLTGLRNTRWRNGEDKVRHAPLLRNVCLNLTGASNVESIGWASPDVNGGQYQPLERLKTGENSSSTNLVIPSLKYWDVVFIKHRSPD